MKILSVSLQNFASYENLVFDCQSNTGITLINGLTGSGKSTLCDALPWLLFGTTAKGGAVNEVLAWPGDKITKGQCIIESPLMQITRLRGPKAKDNDLFITEWQEGGAIDIRGKDIPDTQRLINDRLGFNAETYLAAAYYHEFSQTAQFFQTNAKNRRQLCEQLVDLTLAKNLQEKVKNKLKEIDNDIFLVSTDKIEDTVKILENAVKFHNRQIKEWNKKQADRLFELATKYENFESDKAAKINKISVDIVALKLEPMLDASGLQNALDNFSEDRCHECGSLVKSDDKANLVAEIKKIEIHNYQQKNYAKILTIFKESLKEASDEENTYLEQLEYTKTDENPYLANLKQLEKELHIGTNKLFDLKAEQTKLLEQEADLQLLAEIIADFRSQLVKNTIIGLETQTNTLLSEHFDAEIRVTFDVKDADKLDISITKDGNQCVYSQLSKGQRQLLKLTFGIAVMKQVANHSGMTPNAVFFDEAMDGLDESMKLKAFNMLKSLESEYESIFLVDHSVDLKAMVNNQYTVSLVNGKSEIEKA